jgi:hypothetical protein
MPYYDLQRPITTNGSAGTEQTEYWGTTVANQETVSITGIYCGARFGTAGGAQIRIKDNTGTIASGGTSETPRPRNIRSAPAAQSTWKNSATTITAGATLTIRLGVGFAQTGGMGGWVATTMASAFQMMPNGTNPVDMEWTSIANAASVTADLTIEFAEGTA